MTALSLAVRNLLIQDSAITDLLGKSVIWPQGWIFDGSLRVKLENTSRVAIVVNEIAPFGTPNQHNTMTFPRVSVDIWADPTRNTDKSVQLDDAKNKIEAVGKLVNAHLHTVDTGTSSGEVLIWGTADEILAKTGVVVAGSERLTGPEYNPVSDSTGAWMGIWTFGVHQIT